MKKIVNLVFMGVFLVSLPAFSGPKMEEFLDEATLREAIAVKEARRNMQEIIAKLETSHFREVLKELREKYSDETIVVDLLETIGNKENSPLLRAQAAWQFGEMCYCSDPLLSMPELEEATRDEIELVRRSTEYAIERLTDSKGGVALLWDPSSGEKVWKSRQDLDERVEKVYNKIKEKLIRFLENNEPFDYNVHLALLPEDKKAELLNILEAVYQIEEQALQEIQQRAEELKKE